MKNFVFISPNFPEGYWHFCKELKNNGLRVLGIGDCPYDELLPGLKDNLHEYYKVGCLENYDEVYRAVAFFIHKYGRIDFLESNNEYWLMQDARLRTDFHITSGFQEADMAPMKLKSAMKEYFRRAGVAVARYHLVQDWEGAFRFVDMVGYPVVAKPDNGVGASNTYKIRNEAELRHFLENKDDNVYIMEEYVQGYVQTYDAIINSAGEHIFESGNISPVSCMDIVNNCGECLYYIVKDLPDNIRKAGREVVAQYGVKSRFIHFEFFVLTADQTGLGKKGDVIGLEVNMRPSGGVTPEMYNFAYETDVYKIWADMIAFDCNTLPMNGSRQYCAFIGRRDHRNYVMDHDAIVAKYGNRLKMSGRVPYALSALMADQMYLCNFDTEEDMWACYQAMCETE